jgi:hypothetical protein
MILSCSDRPMQPQVFHSTPDSLTVLPFAMVAMPRQDKHDAAGKESWRGIVYVRFYEIQVLLTMRRGSKQCPPVIKFRVTGAAPSSDLRAPMTSQDINQNLKLLSIFSLFFRDDDRSCWRWGRTDDTRTHYSG